MTFVTKSPWLIHYDGSSCNGCDIEVLACLTPIYDVERFGIINTGNPKHADIFLLTGRHQRAEQGCCAADLRSDARAQGGHRGRHLRDVRRHLPGVLQHPRRR